MFRGRPAAEAAVRSLVGCAHLRLGDFERATALAVSGEIGLSDLVHRFTAGPASIGRVPGGRLADGGRAEVNLIDPATEFEFTADLLRSKSRNCPFLGRRLKGRVVATLAGESLTIHANERFRSAAP